MADDFRATLTAKSNINEANENIFGSNARSGFVQATEIMQPLRSGGSGMNNRVVFPYTPTIQLSGNADYEEYSFAHSNYKYNAYSKSSISEIVITGDFTAQSEREARYMLAVLHFMRSNTKAEFGEQSGDVGGTPPPVLRFNYLGEYQFNNVPVIIKNFTYTLPPDVDYVAINVDKATNGNITRVPTSLNMTVTLDTYYNPSTLRQEFDLDSFKNGQLLKDGWGFI